MPKLVKEKCEDLIGEYRLGERNERGERLVEFIQDYTPGSRLKTRKIK